MNIYVPMCTSMYTSNLYRRCFCLIEEAAWRGVALGSTGDGCAASAQATVATVARSGGHRQQPVCVWTWEGSALNRLLKRGNYGNLMSRPTATTVCCSNNSGPSETGGTRGGTVCWIGVKVAFLCAWLYISWNIFLIKVLNNFRYFEHPILTMTYSEAYLKHNWRNCLWKN